MTNDNDERRDEPVKIKPKRKITRAEQDRRTAGIRAYYERQRAILRSVQEDQPGEDQGSSSEDR